MPGRGFHANVPSLHQRANRIGERGDQVSQTGSGVGGAGLHGQALGSVGSGAAGSHQQLMSRANSTLTRAGSGMHTQSSTLHQSGQSIEDTDTEHAGRLRGLTPGDERSSGVHPSSSNPFATPPSSPSSTHSFHEPSSPSSTHSDPFSDEHAAHPQHVAPVAAEPNVDPDKITPWPPTWKQHDGQSQVNRYDSRPPVETDEDHHPITDQHGNPYIPDDSPFKTGFKPRPGEDSGDLVQYQQNNKPSMFVGTTTNQSLGELGKWGRMWKYQIQPPQGEHGVDVNATLASHGLDNPKPGENEIAFPGGIKPQYIVGAQKFNGIFPAGEFVPNPNFTGSAAGSSRP